MTMLNPYNYSKPKVPVGVSSKKGNAQIKNTTTNRNPYAKTDTYLEQKVMSAKPEELTLMLYEGIVKFLKQAKIHNDNQNVEKSNYSNMRAQSIVEELRATLDMSIEISKEFERLYVYMNERLVEANIHKDNSILDEVIELANDFAATWKEAMKL